MHALRPVATNVIVGKCHNATQHASVMADAECQASRTRYARVWFNAKPNQKAKKTSHSASLSQLSLIFGVDLRHLDSIPARFGDMWSVGSCPQVQSSWVLPLIALLMAQAAKVHEW